MRLFSLLTMAVAAIFFAGSISAHVEGHDTKSSSYGNKIYKVCKSWRVDQGGPMPTNMMQACRDTLCHTSLDNCGYSATEKGAYNEAWCVGDVARNEAKEQLGYW